MRTGQVLASGSEKVGWCFEQMNEARKIVAHPFDWDGVFVSLGNPNTLQAIADLANIAERMVIEILAKEIRVVESLGVSENSRRVIAGYVHESWGRDLLEKTQDYRCIDINVYRKSTGQGIRRE